MGFNIQGIAVSKKCNVLSDITNELGIQVTNEFELSSFEKSISSFIDEDDIFLIPTTNGSIITMGDIDSIFDLSLSSISKNGKALKFSIGETSMAFAFEYYENGELIRSIVTIEDQRIEESGKSLGVEFSGVEDMTELISMLMQEVSGDNIDTLDLSAKAYRHKQVKPVLEKEVNQETNNKISDKKSNTKPWWKLW